MRSLRPFLLLPVLLLGGCASVAPFKGLTFREDSTFVNGVPPVQQDKTHACGPACVAAVAAHWGVALATFKSSHPFLPDDASGQDLQTLAEKLGLQAFAYRGSIDDLHDNLSKGRPLIVMIPKPIIGGSGLVTKPLLNFWNDYGPRPPHWVVAVGFVKNQKVIINDPASGPLIVNQTTFEKWWAKNDNLCVLIAAAAPP
jgi:ABC-type bacteriocin/lantibiotic exporter with double-glycine peptidase domain